MENNFQQIEKNLNRNILDLGKDKKNLEYKLVEFNQY